VFGGQHCDEIFETRNSMCNEHNVFVAAGENGPMWDAFDSKVEKIKIEEIVRPVSPANDIKAFFKLHKLYNAVKPDVIHLHSSKAGILGRLAFPKTKVIYSVHGFDSIRVAYRQFLSIEKALKHRCRSIVLASNYDKQNMIKEGMKDNLHIVYNGIYPPVAEHMPRVAGTEKYRKTVMCIARISPQKRFDSFVEIAKLLPQYAFVWIGADTEYANMPDNLFCLQSFPKASRYIQLADIFVLPSNYEGIPIVIIDALSYGKPVVSSDVGGISEIVLNDQNGYVVANDNTLFAEKIQYILEDEQVYNRFSETSRTIFQTRLTVEKMANQYMNIYRGIYA
jgi:glycosyltransferase involved in cell wall biosynthesis